MKPNKILSVFPIFSALYLTSFLWISPLLSPVPAAAAPITVIVTNTNGDQSTGSLGGAITQIDANVGGGVIDLSGVSSGSTINLTASLPSLSNSVTILGNNVLVDGSTGQILNFQNAPASVANLLVTGGMALSMTGGAANVFVFGNNSYSGGTSVAGSALLNVNADNNLGAVATTLTLDSGTLQTAAGVSFDPSRSLVLTANNGTVNTNGQGSSWNGLINGPGQLVVTGGGTLTLTNTGNTYSGGTSVGGGSTLSVSDPGNLGWNSSGSTMVLDNGTLQNNAPVTGNYFYTLNPLILRSGGGTINTAATDFTHWDGVLSGPGALIVSGPGTLLLSDAFFGHSNTYSGGTLIQTGAYLSINANTYTGGNYLGSGPVTLNGGTLGCFAETTLTPSENVVLTAAGGALDVSAFVLTVNSVISGSGPLTVTSSGTTFNPGSQGQGNVNFNAVNTYTGGTYVTGNALLNVNNDYALGSTLVEAPVTLAGATLQTTTNGITTNRTLALINWGVFDTNTFNSNWNGVVQGAATLIIDDGGTLTLTNPSNSYSGGTSIYQGTSVNVSSDGNLGAPTGLVGLQYGTVQVSAGVSFNPARNMTVDQLGTFDTNGFNSSWNGVINGSGGFDVMSSSTSGSLTLTNQNTYTGLTDILNSTLVLAVPGAIPSTNTIFVESTGILNLNGIPLTVASGGELEGFGTVTGSVVNNGLVAVPAPSGALSITQLTDGVLSTTALQVLPGSNNSSQLDLGSDNLAGSMTITAGAGSYAVRYKYVVISSGSPVTGTFGSVTDNLSYMTPSLAYGPNAVTLILLRNNVDFTVDAQTPNQFAVGTALNQSLSVATDGFFDKLNELYFLPLSGQRTALSQMGGSSYAPLVQIMLNKTQFTTNTLLGHFEGENFGPSAGTPSALISPTAYAVGEDKGTLSGIGAAKTSEGFWMEGGSSSGNWAGNSSVDVVGYDIKNYDIVGGYDYSLEANFKVGLSLGYNHADLTSSDSGNVQTGVDSFMMGAYSNQLMGALNLSETMGFGLDQYQTTRTITLGSDVNQAKSLFGGTQLTGALQASYNLLKGPGFSLRPMIGFQYTNLSQEAFTEKGADVLDLRVAGQSYNSFRPIAGVSAARNFDLSKSVQLIPVINLSASRELGTINPQVQASFAGASGVNFTTSGSTSADPTLVGVGAGLQLAFSHELNFYAHYTGDFGWGESLNTFNGGMNLSF